MAGMRRFWFQALAAAAGLFFLAGCSEISLKAMIRGLASPKNVIALKIESSGSKTFQLKWRDPADPDIDHIEIAFATPFATNAPPPPVNVPAGAQSAVVTVPLNNVWYFITVRTVDRAGNRSPGVRYFNLLGNQLPYTTAPIQTEYRYTAPGIPPGTLSYHYIYTYNGSGVLTQTTEYSDNPTPNTPQSLNDNIYDAAGNKIRENYSYYSAGSWTLSSYTTWEYDLNGNNTRRSYFNSSGTISDYYTYEYDTEGNQIRYTSYNGDGTLRNYTVYTYDQYGHVTSYTSFNAAGAPQNAIELEWDPMTGFISRLTFRDSAGAVRSTGTYRIVTGQFLIDSFDASGTQTRSTVWNFDANGLQTDEDVYDSTGALDFRMTFLYDINGNKLEQVEYQDFGVPPATYRTTYSY